MDAPERDPEPHPTGDAGETARKREQPISVPDVAPPSRTVLPFSRRNYPYSPGSAKSENDLLRPPEVEDDPGPSAA
jgi:hypothetical protein